MKNLVVVESPAKVKTISKFLGKDYEVAASYGHVIDLPKSTLGVDVDKKYKPEYVLSNQKALNSLKEKFRGKHSLIIASDPDREGEAIGWHVAKKLQVIDDKGKPKAGKKIQRIIFTSITKDAVQEAIKNPRELDINLFNAQQARRVLDRLVGYKLSPLLWKKVMFGLSAGRVQSVALKLVVDREEERNKFKPEEFWDIYADVRDKKVETEIQFVEGEVKNDDFKGTKFQLVKIDEKGAKLENKKQVDSVLDKIKKSDWIIQSVEEKENFRYPKPPFTTSTLQQASSNKFGYSAKKTMSVAQKLYEAGFITYMRTDSTSIEPNELNKIRKFIETEIGKDYLSDKPVQYKTKSKSAQEAHEAIRATHVAKTSADLGLTGEKAKVYDLIRTKAMASQMTPARLKSMSVKAKVGNTIFEAKGIQIIFKGFTKVYSEFVAESILPEFKEGQKVFAKTIFADQDFTKPPARYTEATLIKLLEKYGIGRPSTYASIISTILGRKYVEKDGKYLFPTDVGFVVTHLLEKYFEEIVDTDFTAKMENDLDEIAEGKLDWVKSMDEFFKPFIKKVESGDKKIKRDEFTVLGPSKYKCPICGKKMVKKLGRFGAFYSCTDFPKCKGIRSLDGETPEQKEKKLVKKTNSKEFTDQYEPAPLTEKGEPYILRTGRFGDYWSNPDAKKKDYKPLVMRRERIIELFGNPPKTKDKREFVFKEGRFGKFWAHPDYPNVKETIRIKEEKPKEEEK